MTLSRRILNKPMTIIIIFIVLSIAGGALTSRLAVDLLPNIEMPAMAVITTYPMATPTEVEETITRKIEEQMANMSGLDSITSYSSNSMSLVILMLDFGSDMGDATAEVRDKLSRITSILPEESEAPIIFAFDPNDQPVITLALTGDAGLEELLAIAEDEIKPRLERISGAAEVSLSGGLEKIVQVDFYQERMDALGLSISQIADSLASQNMKLGAGQIVESGINYMIQTSGEIASLEELEHTIISRKPIGQGKMYEVLLRDVADVSFGAKDRESIVLINGQEGIQISIKKASDANMVAVVSEVKEVVDEISASLPGSLKLSVLVDNSVKIYSVLRQVISSALVGILFAVFVLLFFLRQIKSTIIVAISIPVSLLITIGGMSLAGKTFNLMTLTGLILALGMIVDGSIVVIENIFRYRQKGALQQSSAELGTQEVIGAITGSILTTVCVFIPILIFKNDLGFIGIMFEDMAFTIILALLSSLAVSIFLVPVLASKVFPITTRDENPIKNRFLRGLDSSLEKSLDRITFIYRRAVGWSLKHKTVVIILSVGLLATAVLQIPNLGIVMIPNAGETSIMLDVSMPEGTTLDVTEEVMLQWQSIALEGIPESDRMNIVVSSGSGGEMAMLGGSSSHLGTLEVTLPASENRSMSDEDIRNMFRNYFKMFPNAVISFSTTDQARMMTGNADVSINVQGNNLDKITEISEELIGLVKYEIPEILEFTSSQSNALPEMELVLDRQRLYDLGLNTQSIAYELRSQIAGVTATTYNLDGEVYNVVLQLREEDRNSYLDINKLFITSNTGQKIPFSSFGEAKKTTGPVSIYRVDRVKTITLSGNIREGAKASFVQKSIEELAEDRLVLPSGVTLSTGGQMEMLEDTMDGLVLVVIFAALLVFAVMVSQFESLKSPFIIFIMIPMLLIGVVGIYLIIGEPLSMPSMIGIVMLLGLVVNNGIILVDSINLHRKRGYNVFDACQEASSNRFRPVIMTTLTTILAMVPMSFFGGADTEMVKPIGITVIGGLTSNTIITLFLVPVLYMLLHRREYKKELTAAKEIKA